MIVETGQGVTGANSYASVADATAFHLDRSNADWAAATSTAQAAALIEATDYIEANYAARNDALTDTQGLQWPTAPNATLPAVLTRSVMLLALQALAGPLSPTLTQDTMATEKTLEGVGTIKTTFGERYCDPYPHITAMLLPIATSRLSGVTIGRSRAWM